MLNKLNIKVFLDEITSKITGLGIDLTKAKLDHIAYQTSSRVEYNNLKPEFEKIAKLIKEPPVGGRRVGVFKFNEPPKYKNQKIAAIELIEPKLGKTPKSGLEHVEYLLPVTLEEFMENYPDIAWDTANLYRDDFPMLRLKLSDNLRVKFPRKSVLD